MSVAVELAAVVADPVTDAKVVDPMEVEAARGAVVEADPDAIALVVALVAVLDGIAGHVPADDASAGGDRPPGAGAELVAHDSADHRTENRAGARRPRCRRDDF